jgi:signal peptidase II
MKQKNNLILTLMILLSIYFADRTTKMLAINYLKGIEPISIFHNTIILKYTENSGAFLGLGSNWPDSLKYILLLIIPILVCLYGLYYCAFKVKTRKLLIASVFIIGGGLGNLIDRLLNNFKVIDFINFGISSIRTGIVNVADMSVTFAVIFLIFDQLRTTKIKQE